MSKSLLDPDSLPKQRGAFTRVLVELTPNGTGGTVIARCECGKMSRVRSSQWASERSPLGCRKCTAKSRSNREPKSSDLLG